MNFINELIPILLKHYPLVKIIDIKIHSGFVNRVFELNLEDGSTYFLRECEKNDTVNSIRIMNEINVLTFHEKKKNKPFLDFIVKTKKGDYGFSFAGKFYTLRKQVPGVTSNYSEMNQEKRYSAGQLLAHLHNSFLFFPKNKWLKYSYKKYRLPIIFHLGLKDLLDLKNKATQYSKKTRSSSTEIWLKNYKKIDSFIDKYVNMRKKINFKYQIIHGDLDPTNVTFIKNEAVGLMDWDFLQISPRILDLGNSLINRPTKVEDDKTYEFKMVEVEAFLSGYNEIIKKKLTDDEIVAIPFSFYHIGLQYLLTAYFLFTKNLPEEKLTNFLKFRFLFLETLDKLGNLWYKKLMI